MVLERSLATPTLNASHNVCRICRSFFKHRVLTHGARFFALLAQDQIVQLLTSYLGGFHAASMILKAICFGIVAVIQMRQQFAEKCTAGKLVVKFQTTCHRLYIIWAAAC
jgi:hypothetical protein